MKEASGGRASQTRSGSLTTGAMGLSCGSVVARSGDDDRSRGVEAAAGSSVVEGARGCCCLKEMKVRRRIERRGQPWCPMEQREERGFEEPKRETTRGGEKETGARHVWRLLDSGEVIGWLDEEIEEGIEGCSKELAGWVRRGSGRIPRRKVSAAAAMGGWDRRPKI